MCVRVRRRCACWETLGLAAAAAFGHLERQGYFNPNPDPREHRTLSQHLGPGWAWPFLVGGVAGSFVMFWHLRNLRTLGDPQ